jgi:hypothetical protein
LPRWHLNLPAFPSIYDKELPMNLEEIDVIAKREAHIYATARRIREILIEASEECLFSDTGQWEDSVLNIVRRRAV